jgi:hypothetical protein
VRHETHTRACSESDRAKGAALAGLALLLFARKKCRAKTAGAETEIKPEVKPERERTKPDRTCLGKQLHRLTKPIRREDQAKWLKEDEERAAREAEEKKGVAPKPEPSGKEVKGEEGGSRLTGIVVNVLGAVATGVGVTGAVAVVGAAIFWARFDAIGVPPVQAVTAMPRTELLVQGAQEMIIFVLIGLGAALLIALADPKGDITYGTIFVIGLLILGAAAFVIFMTTLSWGWILGLIGLALLLALATIGIGFTTGQRPVPLLVSVFVASFVFSASSAFLIVENQRFAQAIAIHFGPNKEGKHGKGKGIIGIYVTATEKTLFYARADVNQADDVGLYEVPRTDTTTYAIGPPEQIEDDGNPVVEKTGKALLKSLAKDAESLPPPEGAGASTKGE